MTRRRRNPHHHKKHKVDDLLVSRGLLFAACVGAFVLYAVINQPLPSDNI
jgi:hypothetical protein